VARLGRAVEVVPSPKGTLLLLDEQRALAREHEEPFLHAFRVVERIRIARREDADSYADVAERVLPRLISVDKSVELYERIAFELVAVPALAAVLAAPELPVGKAGDETTFERNQRIRHRGQRLR